MDTSEVNITFNQAGICNHCLSYNAHTQTRTLGGAAGEAALNAIAAKIKGQGQGKQYDCILGISGGADSTYLAYLAKQKGLRPLAVHLDNGWNSELAVHNIERALKLLGIDLFTHVLDWDEFKMLQLNFLKASTPDGEIPTDHAIFALLMRVANKHNVKYILTGMNYSTEASVVDDWAYGHSDWRYIKHINKKMGGKRLKSFPHYNIAYLFYTLLIRHVKFVSPLNYINYERSKAVALLEKELQWRDYGGKHHESIYTRFFQSHILVEKFGFNKKRMHLSNMIHCGEISREQALERMKQCDYPKDLMLEDKQFLLKKFEISAEEFDRIMQLGKKSFRDYPNHYHLIKRLKALQHWLRGKQLFYR